MSSASARFGTKAYVCARYFLRPGSVSNTSTSVVKISQNTYMRSWHYIRTVFC
jgi:hypothetical protein